MRSTSRRPADGPAPAVRLLSDLPGLPDRLGDLTVRHEVFDPTAPGRLGKLGLALRLYLQGFRNDAILLNQPGGYLFGLCALRTLLPSGGSRLVVFDIIMARPGPGMAGRIAAALKRLLLKRVHMFLLHVKDPGGLDTFYGIAPARSRFVPFKVNGLGSTGGLEAADRGYVLAPGKSQRDYPTFREAMAGLPYRALILMPDSGRESERHGTAFEGRDLPPNVEIVHDDGSAASWARQLAGARLVALPIRPEAISAAGNSTYLQAMALGKCVVMSDCPGARGIVEDGRHALIVPPGDPVALRDAIRRAWEDDDLRRRLAAEGRAYALSLGGEERLFADLVREVVDLLGATGRPRPGDLPSREASE